MYACRRLLDSAPREQMFNPWDVDVAQGWGVLVAPRAQSDAEHNTVLYKITIPSLIAEPENEKLVRRSLNSFKNAFSM